MFALGGMCLPVFVCEWRQWNVKHSKNKGGKTSKQEHKHLSQTLEYNQLLINVSIRVGHAPPLLRPIAMTCSHNLSTVFHTVTSLRPCASPPSFFPILWLYFSYYKRYRHCQGLNHWVTALHGKTSVGYWCDSALEKIILWSLSFPIKIHWKACIGWSRVLFEMALLFIYNKASLMRSCRSLIKPLNRSQWVFNGGCFRETPPPPPMTVMHLFCSYTAGDFISNTF